MAVGVCTFVRALRTMLLASGVLAAQAQGLTVSQQGGPSYVFPIQVPPGIANVAPRFAIAHDGNRSNGPLGIGWSLQGVSVITRCHGIAAIDGSSRKGVANTAGDKLCLDGQRLIQTDASGVPAAFPQQDDSLGLTTGFREYRTELDSFARIRAYGIANGSASNGPAYFKVWTKSGQIYEYGAGANSTANATITAVGANTVVTWATSRISDAHGNYVDFQYDQRSVDWGSATSPTTLGREWNLIEARYTGTPTQQPTNKVVFVYEERPATPATGQSHERAEAYVLGAKYVTVRRLAKVQTFVNIHNSAVKAKTFKLVYGNGPISNRSRLERIAECVGAAEQTCLPPIRFEYEAGGSPSYQASSAFNTGTLATLVMHSGALGLPPYYGAMPPVRYGVITADFNGDGKTDIIRWSDNAAENRLYFSNGDGSFTQSAAFNITTENFYKTDGCYSSAVADFNGDGLPDVFRYRHPTGFVQGWTTNSPCPTGTNELFLSNGDGSFTRKPVTGVTPWQSLSLTTVDQNDNQGWTRGETYYLMDVNGDGRVDIVTTLLPFKATTAPEVANPCADIVCTRVFLGDGQGAFTEIPTNVANRTLYSPPQGAYALGQPSHINDVDGDGIDDITDAGAIHWIEDTKTFRSRGDGNFDERAAPNCTLALDFNGDGRTDCLYPIPNRTAAPYARVSVAIGTGSTKAVSDNFSSALLEDGFVNGEKKTFANVIVGDFDGDARQDVLRWHDDPSRNALFLSNGDGTFRESPSFNLKASAHQLQKSDESAAFVIGDFTGRGEPEILRLRASPTAGDATSNQLYAKTAESPPPDVLAAVISGTGARTSLVWVSHGNSASGTLGNRYVSDRGTTDAAAYPNFDLPASGYVVARTAADNGLGGQVVTEYSYRGLKGNHEGRGALGLREMRRQKPGPNGANLTETSRVLQVHPYIGMNAAVETWLGELNQSSPPVIARTRAVYCDTTAASAAQASATFTAPCPTSAKIQRPYPLRITDDAWDLTSAGLPPTTTATTTSSFNGTGDPTQVVVVKAGKVGGIDQSFTETTTHLYRPDDTVGENWILGRAERTTVANSAPNSLGSLSAAAGNSPYAGAVVGTGPTQSAAISNVAFGSVSIASSSTAVATIKSNGPAALNLTVPGAASVSGADFSFVSTTCSSPLAAGNSCTVTVSFRPTAPQARTGTLTVVTAAGNLVAGLSGTGLGSAATVQSNAAFGSNPYGAAIADKSVTVLNSGNANMTLTVGGHGAPFALVANACSNIAPGGTCAITFSMSSGTISTATQSVSLSGASTGAVTATLSGTVTGSRATLVSGDLSFAAATYGAVAPSKTLTIRNDGNAAMTLSGLSGLAAPFSVSGNTCSGVAAGGSCTITVSMATSTMGNWSQTATTTGASVNMSASAVGTVAGTIATITSGNLAFGNASLDASTLTRTLTVRNDGNSSMTLSGLSGLSTPFSVTGNTCSGVAAGASCSITVSMATANLGSWSQTALTTGASVNSSSAASGAVNGSIATFIGDSGVALNFGTVAQGGTVPTRSWAFRNDGNVAMSLSLSALNSPFSATNYCAGTVSPGATCSIVAAMGTATVGSFSQNAVATSGAARGNRSDLSLSGTVNPSSTTASASPTSLSWSSVPKGSTTTKSLTLTNTGAVTATNLNYVVSYTTTSSIGDHYRSGGTCPASGGSLAAGASCTVVIAFAANCQGGTRNGTLNISGNFSLIAVPLSSSVSSSGTCQ